MVLSQDHLAPDRVFDGRILQGGVFCEVAQNGRLEDRFFVFAVAVKGSDDVIVGACHTPVYIQIPVPVDIGTVGLFRQQGIKVFHCMDIDLFDHKCSPFGLISFLSAQGIQKGHGWTMACTDRVIRHRMRCREVSLPE